MNIVNFPTFFIIIFFQNEYVSRPCSNHKDHQWLLEIMGGGVILFFKPVEFLENNLTGSNEKKD